MTKEIAEQLGIELDALQDAFKGYKVMSNEDFDTFKKNTEVNTEELKDKYQAEGRKVGKELLLKELKDDFGLTYEGRKSKDNLINAITEKFATSSSEEYASKLKELSSKYEAKENEFESFKSEILEKENKRFVSDTLKSEFDQYKGKTSLDTNDLITLFTAKNNVKYNGESINIYDGESIVKDEMMNPLTVQTAIKSFVEGSYLVDQKPQGGRGQGDSSGFNSKMTVEQYSDKLVKEGISAGSQQHSESIVQAIESGMIQ